MGNHIIVYEFTKDTNPDFEWNSEGDIIKNTKTRGNLGKLEFGKLACVSAALREHLTVIEARMKSVDVPDPSEADPYIAASTND